MDGRGQSAPLVSVLLPARNAQSTLDGALRSLVAQTWQNLEIIVVDDHSQDATSHIVRQWAQRDPRIKLLANRGEGLMAALKTASEAAQGEYLARMDADDISAPTRVALQMEHLMSDDAYGLCATHVCDFGSVGEGRRAYSQWLASIRSHDDVVRHLFVECPVAHPTFLLRRSAFESVGGYRDVPWAEDYDLVFRLWLAGWKFAVVPEPLLRWRDRPDRLSRTDVRYSEEAFRQCKLHYFLRSPYVSSRASLLQWGAGKEGKWWLRHWPPPLRPSAVVDIDRRKIGQRIHGVPVIAPVALGKPRGRFLVVAVGVRGVREEIRRFLSCHDWKELKDYIFLC